MHKDYTLKACTLMLQSLPLPQQQTGKPGAECSAGLRQGYGEMATS